MLPGAMPAMSPIGPGIRAPGLVRETGEIDFQIGPDEETFVMATLRLAQHPGGAPDRYRVEVGAEGFDRLLSPLSVEFQFALTGRDREEIRWYLEDYLEYFHDPAPQIAARIEQRMAAIGEELFRAIFGTDDARDLWATIRPHLAETRIEVTAGIAEATAIPWELIRDPRINAPLALTARAFVRGQRAALAALPVAQAKADKVRILLVICRPKGSEDVPFRSVASRLIKGLSGNARAAFDLDVLRPPTYESLARVLREARDRHFPYHIVHFDGHGTYANPAELAMAGRVLSNLRLDARSTGSQGFLMFEDSESFTRGEFVDGFTLGRLLAETRVSVLVLNACQSAFAQAAAQPSEVNKAGDVRAELQAYGSLAQEVIDSGTAGVVAMGYSIYVVTAAQFVGELYAVLARGRTLGEAVTRARKNLADKPDRQIAFEARPLQDWSVPVVYERAPLALWPEPQGTADIKVTLDEAAATQPGVLDKALPPRPDIGFYGRDGTLYGLDRGFDRHPIVLLHAYAGAGKTATATEFARWYALTGGLEGPVLFSSFERHLPLARLLDKIGQMFSADLKRARVPWDAITETGKRRDIALQMLSHKSILWIWDNIEPVTGFPLGTPSEWTVEQQRELLEFLRAMRETKAKVLITSRRDEQAWLGDLPIRVKIPPMPMRERSQLVGAIAERHGRHLADLPDLRSLLEFTQGNPLTILVAVGQILRDGVGSQDRLEAFVASLRAGEASFADEESEGRSKSLGASLAYGFQNTFTDDEQRILALLHLFQGFVASDVLHLIGELGEGTGLAALRRLSREALAALLGRAAEIGLLIAHGPKHYSIHPALPWYLRKMFAHSFPTATGEYVRAQHAFARASAATGEFIARAYNDGNHDVLADLADHEDNLLAAWRLAVAHGWWQAAVMALQGLRSLYLPTGRHVAWKRLVDAATPYFVDPASDGPLVGVDPPTAVRQECRAELWQMIAEYRTQAAVFENKLVEAERLQRIVIAWRRSRTVSARIEPGGWEIEQQDEIRLLAGEMNSLGVILLRQGKKTDAAQCFQEAFNLDKRFDYKNGQAHSAFNIGDAMTALGKLKEAERWLIFSMELRDSRDARGHGMCLDRLGGVAFERFLEAKRIGRPDIELSQHLNAAIRFCEQALDHFLETAAEERARTYWRLGAIYLAIGKNDRAVFNYQRAIRYSEGLGDYFSAGKSRFSAAVALMNAGVFVDALAYATAALQNLRDYDVPSEIQITQQLIVDIELRMQGA